MGIFFFRHHHSLDLSTPICLIDETVKNTPDVLKRCQVKLSIELASSLRNGEDDQMTTSSDEVVPMDDENEIAIKQSDGLCGQPYELDESDGVFQTEEMETENGYGEQEIPNAKDPRINSFTSVPQQFSTNSRNVVQSRSVQVAGGAPDTTLSSSSNVAAIGSTAKAEDKKETGQQLSRKVTHFKLFCFLLIFFNQLQQLRCPKVIELMICFCRLRLQVVLCQLYHLFPYCK